MNEVRVLIVDDQKLARQAMVAVVDETQGFVVVAAVGSGEESLTATVAWSPDLVLMDVNLPGIDGLETTRRLRSIPGAPIVMLLSTYDELDVDVSGSGAASYITKSTFEPERLVAAWATATEAPRPTYPDEAP